MLLLALAGHAVQPSLSPPEPYLIYRFPPAPPKNRLLPGVNRTPVLDPLRPQSKPGVVVMRDASRLLGAEMLSACVEKLCAELTREDI